MRSALQGRLRPSEFQTRRDIAGYRPRKPRYTLSSQNLRATLLATWPCRRDIVRPVPCGGSVFCVPFSARDTRVEKGIPIPGLRFLTRETALCRAVGLVRQKTSAHRVGAPSTGFPVRATAQRAPHDPRIRVPSFAFLAGSRFRDCQVSDRIHREKAKGRNGRRNDGFAESPRPCVGFPPARE